MNVWLRRVVIPGSGRRAGKERRSGCFGMIVEKGMEMERRRGKGKRKELVENDHSIELIEGELLEVKRKLAIRSIHSSVISH